ncbi:DinB family protein [Ichthyenterobacterium sp. W332]|uniref:DinB family protein n=1 Tax=Microcosmobacter mediterraneus TaxID=3075607 RepID=A0ABU2YG44_9FLAO|nr:DinB family protein [Ichthyenterobacterium sp. W332]MDT0557154.1 DinB family protein [Ichthyenterobacterium sp. W332]
MTPRKLNANESSDYFKRYINLVETQNIVAALKYQLTDIKQFFKAWPKNKWDYAYAEGKWTIKELFIHMMDAERILAYRALRIARNDATALPGFDQDEFAPFMNATNRSPESVMSEYRVVRMASIALFENLDDEALSRIGTASNAPASPLALAFIIAGHEIHHMKVIKDKYV